jgi:hypothetical protein
MVFPYEQVMPQASPLFRSITNQVFNFTNIRRLFSWEKAPGETLANLNSNFFNDTE